MNMFFSPQHFLFFFSPQIYFGDATGEHLYGRVKELTVKHAVLAGLMDLRIMSYDKVF